MMAMILTIPAYLGDSRYDTKLPRRVYTIQKKNGRWGNTYGN